MKRLLPIVAILLGWAVGAGAAALAPLTSLRAIHALSNEEAGRALPVAFEATITYFRPDERTMFVEDAGAGIYLQGKTNSSLLPGDRVLIKGTTHQSLHTVIDSTSITLIRHGSLPQSIPATFGPLIQGKMDSMYVILQGVVRSAEPALDFGRRVSQLEVMMDSGEVEVIVDSGGPGASKDLLDATVEVTGVAAGVFDSKIQQTGVLIHSASLADVKVLRKATVDAWSLPVTPMDQVLDKFDVRDRSGRVRVQGTITYFYPAYMAVLQDGNRSIRVLTPEIDPLRVGDRAEASGIPEVDDGFLAVKLGKIRSTGAAAPIAPLPVTWDELASGKYAFDLVSIEGKVVSQVREHTQDLYIVSVGNQLFSAALRHPFIYDSSAATTPPPMPQIRAGSKVRVTGVAVFDEANPASGVMTFAVLLRTPSDVAVIANPSWLSVRNLMFLVGLLAVAVVAFGFRGWALEHKVRRHATTLARRIETEANLERLRSCILEDINRSRPLAEIVEQITRLVSFKVGGAPCWCQIHDGARLGSYPPESQRQTVVRRDIPSRSGQVLGALFACLALPAPSTEESEALTMGAGLVELAIETRRLYSDLRHRSEFDLLTDIHNRFSIETRLDALIAETRETAGIFGLIYIDLDDFKQVNDLHGHRTGDLYLQEVALRMKRQLRAHDMLARLGGDEFAAVAPLVRSRADVEDVAMRLERCFDEPFRVEGIELRGSASVGIALYPEDGKTRDSLLGAADAAMYVAKNTRRKLIESASVHPTSGLNAEKRT
ncbi:MAG: GGDEF domain-containing protein [Terracidiphilus sp.]